MIDFITQYLRCYVEPREKQAREKRNTASRRAATFITEEGKAIKAIGAPYEGWCLVLDTETTTDTTQRLRFGVYAIYGISRDERMRLYREGRLTREALDTPTTSGIFYDRGVCSPHEVEILRAYCVEHALHCMTKSEFIRSIFYPWVYTRQAQCVGHNLPFDLSRLIEAWKAADGDFRGGFTLTLCDCGQDDCFDHPPVRIKHLGKPKAFIGFRTVTIPTTGGITRKKGYRGRFLDTATFGRALLGPGALSLEGMCKRFRVAYTKRPVDLSGEISAPVLTYCREDVAATWDLYRAERELYKRHGTSRPPWEIYSEASLGKAYFADLGIQPFMRQNPNFPREVIGHAMVGYYGGRCEVKIRLKPTEVIVTDYLSQYPSVNALMRLQDFLLSEHVDVERCADEIRSWLASPDLLAQLQNPKSWMRLRCIVLIRPNEDCLPIRTTYGEGPAATNIGLNYVTGPPSWYTLADVVASVLISGRIPEILDAERFVPLGRIAKSPWRIFDDERYTIDLSTDDLFTAVINLRRAVNADLELADTEEEQEHLDGLQRALKLLANSTSYGALLEVNRDERTERGKPVSVYHFVDQRTTTQILERPGRYFAGPVGALIPAGGRLLLAIAERLAMDRGLSYASCDTDAMAFARPIGTSRKRFHQLVDEIVAWFKPLSPYAGQPPLLEIEKENFYRGKRTPLHFLGVSAKRYALYNRRADGTFRIRKFSAHGTGTWTAPRDYVPPPHIPEPDPVVLRESGDRWLHDLWYDTIQQAEAGTTEIVAGGSGLDVPALHPVTISTMALANTYRRIERLWPFSFLTVLPPLSAVKRLQLETGRIRERRKARFVVDGKIVFEEPETESVPSLRNVSFYAPMDDLSRRSGTRFDARTRTSWSTWNTRRWPKP